MISLDSKTQRTSSSPLSLSTSDEKPTLSFSELLRGASDKKGAKVVQNGALVLSLGVDEKEVKPLKSSAKSETLLSLLKNKEVSLKEPQETLELNPKLTQALSVNEMKTLVNDAKNYLKTQILQSDEYKNAQIKELPKTLKGLAKLAEMVGVDVRKITIQDVQTKPADVKTSFASSSEVLQAKDTKGQTEVPLAKETKQPTEPLQVKDTKGQTEVVLVKEAKQQTEVPLAKETKLQAEVAHAKDVKQQVEVPQMQELKSAPLFKAQTQTEHTTEQIIQTKQVKVEEKTPKDKADETLKLLLRGDKATQNTTGLTADFSVATARVLAPTSAMSTSNETTNTLEKLLHGETKETKQSTTDSKTDGLGTLKADSFEVKLNEAKQMIKYLSADVKTAIEDYKSPFTRVKIQLNPQQLGEIDLTIVQRGKNLHINMSSNNTAINALSMNVNELKAQLTNNGINNATFNFSNQSDSQNSQQQQNRQNQRQAEQEYNYYENEDSREEILSSLEIVVPQYG